MTWYVDPGAVAVATGASEPFGVSVAIGLDEPSDAVSTGGELIAADCTVGVSVVAGLSELSDVVSIGRELVVADSAAGASAMAGLSELSDVVSVRRELVVAACPVAGVDDAATEGVFGAYITARPTKTRTTPVNSAIVPQKSCFALEVG